MKFRCGQSREQKRSADEMYIDKMRNWHTIFAYVPHRTKEGICVWLEKLERRFPYAHVSTFSDRPFLEEAKYRLIPTREQEIKEAYSP